MKLSSRIWKELGALSQHVEALEHDNGTARYKSTATAQDIAACEAVLAAHNPLTPDEDDVAQQAIKQLRIDTKATAMYSAIQTATLAQIDTWVDTNFPALNTQQRALLKVLTAAAGAYLRERNGA